MLAVLSEAAKRGPVWRPGRATGRQWRMAASGAERRGLGAGRQLVWTGWFKAPRSGVRRSATRLDPYGKALPWAHLSVQRSAAVCKRRGRSAARRGDGSVCSKAVSSRLCRLIHRPGTAAPLVRQERGVGGVGVPAGRIGPRLMARPGGENSAVSIASGCMPNERSRKRSLPMPPKIHRPSRARASAQPQIRKNLAAPGRAAMNCSCAAAALRCRSAVDAYAVWLYGVFASVKRGGDGG